ncbi:aldo/keto reductase [Bartonella sp. HY038]|uniref:aldo/keto reductase n=1 Tax=Bartonella sp. HY038 TaxID=2759660 RepID=UPI0015FCE2DA|nr:aldo/keto reductase [Bartonella sp. HY038]
MPVPNIRLNDKNSIPQLGFGVWKIDDKDTDQAVINAINTGYRHIDTAKIYHNEEGVGRGIGNSGVNRGDVFIATKIWNDAQGYDATLRAFDESLQRLNMDYIDLYLIHWPMPSKDLFVDTWKALIQLKKEKRVKSIGVCNFRISDLERLIQDTGVVPSVNQIELHPEFQQNDLRIFHEKNNIVTEAWAPLARGSLLDNPILIDIAKNHNRTVAQVILRWHIEIGNVIIPKSISPQRMAENFNIFDFSLTKGDHERIVSLDGADGRTGPDPDTFVG